MEINAIDIVYHILNIGVLFVLLRLLLYKPVSAFMQARTARIEAQLRQAATVQQETEAAKTSYEDFLRKADEQAKAYLFESTGKANAQAAAILEKAQAEAEEMVRVAQEKSQEEQRAVTIALREQIAEMAISLAGQILQREVREQDNRKLIDTFFEQAV